eukprot:GILK01010594.1.p1 GENE.GILK01010594.1~~GILK01010594.1.p1  ORF type:complete len:1785 (+),score=269.78 GILK01010594.1:74-5428(+)
MTYLAQQQGLVMGSDVVGFASTDVLLRNVYDDMGSVAAFADFQVAGNTISYKLYLNTTNIGLFSFDSVNARFGVPSIPVAFGQAITNAFISSSLQSPEQVLSTSFGPFAFNTQPADPGIARRENIKINTLIRDFVPVALLLGVAVAALISLSIVASEKRKKMMKSLRMMGLLDSSYWLSWLLITVVPIAISSLVAAAVASVIGGVYSHASFSVMLVLLFMFDLSFTCMTFFVTSIITRPVLVNLVVFFLLASSLVSELVFLFYSDLYSGTTPSYFDKLWSPGSNPFQRYALSALPWFHFGKIYSQINSYALTKQFFGWTDLSINLRYQISEYPTPVVPRYWEVSTPSDSLLTMLLLCIIYLVCAWYFGQVFGGDWGASKPFYFPLDPAYWGLLRRGNSYVEGDTLHRLSLESRERNCILLHKLSKAYDKTTALKEVSFELRRGEICCLLGHNGSGKSTMMNLLTGFTEPTHGHAFVFGEDLRTQTNDIQAKMGVCPQDDVLWDELSARQHLHLYGRFKGVPWRHLKQQVDERLEDVALTENADNPAGSYSGGMRRRLSVAISSMGDPQVIFLDEPTTGMDPISRRKVWLLIQKLKENRVVVLTTHSMEEADMLGDHIAVLSHGRLRAAGSSLFLKNCYGRGYQINMLVEPANESLLRMRIPQWLPGAEIISGSVGNLTVSLPKRSVPNLPAFLRRIESEKQLVKEWGLSNTTLEEVFSRLVAQTTQVNAELAQASAVMVNNSKCALCQERPAVIVTLYTGEGIAVQLNRVLCLECVDLNSLPVASIVQSEHDPASDHGAPVPVAERFDFSQFSFESETPAAVDSSSSEIHSSEKEPLGDDHQTIRTEKFANKIKSRSRLTWIWIQFRALMLKELSFQMRQRKTMGFQLLVLVAVIVASWVITRGLTLTDSTLANFNLCPQGFVDPSYGVDPNGCSLSYFRGTFNDQVAGSPLRLSEQFLGLMVDEYTTEPGSSWRYPPNLWYSYPPSAQDPVSGNSAYQMNGGRAVWVKQDYAQDETALYQQSVNWMQDHLTVNSTTTCSSLTNFWFHYENSFDAAFQRFLQLYPFLSIKFKTYSVTAAKPRVDAQIRVLVPGIFDNGAEDLTSVYYPWYPAYTSHCNSVGFSNFHQAQDDFIFPSIAKWVADDVLYKLTGKSMQMDVYPFPTFKYPLKQNDILDADLQVLLVSLVVFIPFAPMVYRLVSEKQDRQLQLMRMMGLRLASYWLANYVFNMMIYLAIFGVYVLIGQALTFSLVTSGVNPQLLIPALAVSGHAMIGTGCFIASIIRHARTALVVSVVISIMAPAVCFLLNMFLTVWPDFLLLIPVFGFPHALGVFVELSTQDLLPAVLVIFYSGTVFLFVGIYLHAVIPSNYGHAEHPLFFLPSSWLQLIRSRSAKKKSSVVSNGVDPMLPDSQLTLPLLSVNVASILNGHTQPVLQHTDEDVQAEKERLILGDVHSRFEYAVCIKDLRKAFSSHQGSNQAVDGLYLGVREGECFGLLGPNGAGKTTTLSILSGMISADSGEAYVAGCDTRIDQSELFTTLGSCPQFDSVWSDLTVEEHLNLFARLKGVPKRSERAAVRRAAEEVLLDGDAFDNMASELSGGMRRRLSLAISFLGDSKVVLLDEPTTGLDPETRRSIWNIIAAAKSQRSLILTTHSMEEAETLCTRLGIMVRGQMRCVGSPLHLKAKYGDGYHLKLILPHGATLDQFKAVHQFIVTQICADAHCVQLFGQTVSYLLPQAALSIASVFTTLEEHKASLHVQEWGLMQTSLDEVFIKLVNQYNRRGDIA